MLKTLIIFKESNLVAAFDEAGQQVAEEQGHLVELYCRALMERGGVVTEATAVHFYDANGEVVDTTAGELVKRWQGLPIMKPVGS